MIDIGDSPNFAQFYTITISPSRYNAPGNIPYSVSVWVPSIMYLHGTDNVPYLSGSGGTTGSSSYVNFSNIQNPVLVDTGLTPTFPGDIGKFGSEIIIYGTYVSGNMVLTLSFTGIDGSPGGTNPTWGSTPPMDVLCSVYDFRLSYQLVTNMPDTSSHNRALLNVEAQ